MYLINTETIFLFQFCLYETKKDRIAQSETTSQHPASLPLCPSGLVCNFPLLCLPKANVPNNHGSSIFCQFCVPQVFFYLMKEPVPSHEHRVCCYAWYFKQQGFQQNVLWLVGSKSCLGKKKKKIILEECHNFIHLVQLLGFTQEIPKYFQSDPINTSIISHLSWSQKVSY